MTRAISASLTFALVTLLIPVLAMADRYGIGEDGGESSSLTSYGMAVFLGVVLYALWSKKK